MSQTTSGSTDDRPAITAPGSGSGRITITADMIASNLSVGVAPDPREIGVIDDVYAFADTLRSVGRR